jgi:DNA polymerase III delta prime subunit
MNTHLNIHENIKEKLCYFHSIHKIPNILFNGPSGSGKSTIVNEFINLIYDNNRERIKDFVMYVNCAHGKGIKFIREELKFFAKTHINSNSGNTFKSIVLLNGDKLTMDAQSALRRCIELFSHSTRFFIVVEDKYKLLKPILSRFCEIYVPEPKYNETVINLYKYNLEETFRLGDVENQRMEWLKKELTKTIHPKISENDVIELAEKLHEKACSALDIMKLIETDSIRVPEDKKWELMIAFNKAKKEFRSEKLLMLFIIHFAFLDLNTSLENMTFM